MELRRAPILEKRAKVLSGEIDKFDEFTEAFDLQVKEVDTIVGGIIKNPDDDKKDDDEKEHVPTDVSHLVDAKGVPDFWAVAVKNNMLIQ